MQTTEHTAVTSEFIQALPKAEIHVHLEGAIQPETVLRLARRNKKLADLPANNVAGLRRWFTFTDFPHFVQIYLTIQNLIRTPEDFELITYELGADMARQNIRYSEATFTAYSHTDLFDKGLTIDDILQGLEAGRQRAKQDFGVEIRWVFDVPRNLSFPQRDGQKYDPKPAERTLEHALAGRDKGVVGFGLGGYEVTAPGKFFAHAFDEAEAAGLLCVPHAGENSGAESVRNAIDLLHAHRIGHGVRAMENPALLAILKERQIPLEVNPTSNICLHVYRRLAEHPFLHLDKMGLLLTVNSDDPPLFNTSLTQEYEVLAREFGYTQAGLIRIARNAFAVCGAEPALKSRLLAEFDTWVATQPENGTEPSN